MGKPLVVNTNWTEESVLAELASNVLGSSFKGSITLVLGNVWREVELPRPTGLLFNKLTVGRVCRVTELFLPSDNLPSSSVTEEPRPLSTEFYIIPQHRHKDRCTHTDTKTHTQTQRQTHTHRQEKRVVCYIYNTT